MMTDVVFSIRNVSKSFGTLQVLKNVTFDIPKSKVFAIIGPSGAGKSTLVRTLNGLEGINGGKIFFEGICVQDKKTNINKLRMSIGFVSQSFNLYPHLSVLNNVTLAPIHVRGLPRREADEKGRSILASLGLADKELSYPSQLSGGQQQRVAIARALAMEPHVILFDEPTSALDPELIKEVLDAIRQLAKTGMTMVVVTHEMSFAREICDQIVFMDHGVVLEITPPLEFFSEPKTPRAKEFLSKILHH
ncbi:MAG TPA: amino acid ABC transporter ATP-binding protein [Synergistales bacterium]|jgi:ABC-type polar amino acid transport system ATPase subunit|nr:amino acid ABC transporter ATP-binding protein [Synergistales bacterium]